MELGNLKELGEYWGYPRKQKRYEITVQQSNASSPREALLERLKDYDQEEAIAHRSQLPPRERHLFLHDLRSLDLPRIDRIIRCSLTSQGLPAAATEPVAHCNVSTVEERTPEDREKWWKAGLRAISEGKMAILLLAGDIGLPSGRSLFQIQAERIFHVQKLTSQTVNEGSAGCPPIHWYIMTSPFIDETTRKYFEANKYFGLEASQATFFQQGTIPCVSKDGRFIMETPFKVAKAPDGNGGVFSALSCKKLLEDMAARGVKYIDCYGVDNAPVRVADPTFLGYFMEKGVFSVAKVVRKAYPKEKVGVFVR
ncbi:hypothetical protein SAY87_006015 [Trapa incisa]|uniref:UDP-N-acetylglucosamine diphosphorylase n=1 Tax=Trapa incisa TaxID=236973 RepID=A0AAN7KC12_9MYRT|nr:hypothetical protein SAY87_006015 [Trapa incisa]